MNAKQLLLIFILCAFPLKAMQEIKVTYEREASKELQKYRVSKGYLEINQSYPNSVKFLIKVLGTQKDKKGKKQSEVIKNGLPDVLIYKIINEYLKIYWFYYPKPPELGYGMALTSDFNEMLTNIINGIDIDDIPRSIKRMTITENRFGFFEMYLYFDHPTDGEILLGKYFNALKKPVLDINPKFSFKEELRREVCKIEAFILIIMGIVFFYMSIELVH